MRARWLSGAAALLLALSGPAAGDDPAPPGFLGVAMTAEPVPDSSPPQAWVRVSGVVPGSAAAAAGLEEGDVLLAIDGEPAQGAPDQVIPEVSRRIRARRAGDRLRLTIRRRVLSVRATLDEERELAPEQEASGSRADRILPDLARLLAEHPGGLVTVRARSDQRERVFDVVLGLRPGTSTAALPPNASLRPDLEALPLDPAAALALAALERAPPGGVAAVGSYQALLERLEQDERMEDPWRLSTVRYLHRAPPRLAGATRWSGRRLANVVAPGADTLGALVATVGPWLDAPAPAPPSAEEAPGAGADPESWARWVGRRMVAARAEVEAAQAALSAEERAFLAEALPSLADRFAVGIYLHEDPDAERFERHRRALELAGKVDRAHLLAALAALAPLGDPALLTRMRDDLRAAEAAGRDGGFTGEIQGRLLWMGEVEGVGTVVVGSGADNVYRIDAPLVIDPGGDDVYHRASAGGAAPGRPVAVLLDLDGDDRYQATEPFAQGSALLGAALLVDLAGDDVYTSNAPFAQGASLVGAAALLDHAGRDRLRAGSYGQGAALLQGLAALVDLGGDDELQAGLYAQGFAGPGAGGFLLAAGGDDRYAALGQEDCSYGDRGTYQAMSQGSAVGFRQLASGGIAALVDTGGSDVYEAGNFSQGGGYYFGWGFQVDLGASPDRYEGSRYAQGFAAHSAIGSFWDEGGDDHYRTWVGAGQGASWDLTVTAFLDDGGDDVGLSGPGFSLGASAHNGFSLFCDGGGRDRYRVAPGQAGPNDYHGGPSVSVFLDAGGDPDVYEGSGLADGEARVNGDVGVALDLPGALEDGAAALDRLWGPDPARR